MGLGPPGAAEYNSALRGDVKTKIPSAVDSHKHFTQHLCHVPKKINFPTKHIPQNIDWSGTILFYTSRLTLSNTDAMLNSTGDCIVFACFAIIDTT